MPRVCTVCTSPDRDVIDEALIRRDSLRAIAQRCRVTKDAVARHRRNHLPGHLVKAKEAGEVVTASALLRQMQNLQEKTLAILDAAENQRTALAAVSQARGNIQLLAEMTGELAAQPTVNILVSPEWVTVRRAMLEALLPFPQARAEVAGRLIAMEGNGGDDRG